MTDIHTFHLEFLEEAKAAFNENSRLETYRNENDSMIALRYGPKRDCIWIYELGSEVAFFHNVANPTTELVIKNEN